MGSPTGSSVDSGGTNLNVANAVVHVANVSREIDTEKLLT